MSWYKTWFNSPWYHLLYEHRNEAEAEAFLGTLITHLHPAPGTLMLDVGCGKGRHAVFLNQKGFKVTGIDLSTESIKHCLQFENTELSFYVHDMRQLFRVNGFDYVLNLFTSFGYFENDHEHGNAIHNMGMALKKGGTLILDFLNPEYVTANLIAEETVTRGDIQFNIQRSIQNKRIRKVITFELKGQQMRFEEHVAAYNYNDFENYFRQSGLELVNVFGNYKLEAWESNASERMIFEVRK